MPPRRPAAAASARPKPLVADLVDGRKIRAEATRPADAGAWHWRVRRCEAPREPVTAEVLGAHPVGTVAQVRAALARYVADCANTEKGSAAQGDPRLQTLVDLMNWYAKACRKLLETGDQSLGTVLAKESTSKVFSALPAATCSVRRLRDGDIDDMVAALRRRYRTQTVHLQMKHLRSAWNWARRHELVPDRDFPRVIIANLGDDKLQKVTPTRGQLREICEQLPQPWQRRAFLIMTATGCRRGEVCNLTTSQVDHERQGIHVRGKCNPRWVPMAHAPEAWAALLEQLAEAQTRSDGRVFPKTAKHHLNEEIRPVAAELYQVRVTTNALRRRASRDLLSSPQAIDPAVYERLMGHSWQMAREEYVTEDAIDVAEAAARVGLGVLPRGQLLELKRKGSG